MKEPIKPYGDTLNDGMVQLSFTLPVENGARAEKAAEHYVAQLNFENISVVHAQKIADGFTYFMVYAAAKPTIDYSTIEAAEMAFEHMDFYAINALIKESLDRPLRVVGGTIGSDAHTVGIDAIMNMKGYNQDYGLERYPEIEAHNLGSQIPCQEMIEQAVTQNADAILVSQTVTQKDSHILHLTELIELLERAGLRDQFLLLAGGAKINHELAISLGYDAGFGPGTVPSQVASLLITKIIERTA
jgi:beta-lysine 5,6-aminomutase beta subunit